MSASRLVLVTGLALLSAACSSSEIGSSAEGADASSAMAEDAALPLPDDASIGTDAGTGAIDPDGGIAPDAGNGACQLEVPATLDFGRVLPGRTLTLPVEIRNRSSTDCAVTASVSGTSAAGFSIIGGPNRILTVEAGASVSLDVQFASPADGQYQGALDLTPAEGPVRRVALSALSGGDCLLLTPNPLDFGEVQVGCSKELAVSLMNVCAGSAAISRIDMAAAPSGFAITQLPAERQIPSGGSLQLKVSLKPEGAVALRSLVRIETDAGLYHLALTGSGKGSLQTDRFDLPARQKIDVLMILDTSCSMDDDQPRVSAFYDAFLAELVSKNLDFKLAWTLPDVSAEYGGPSICTGACANGQIQPPGDPRITTPAGTTGGTTQNSGGGTTPVLIRPAYLALSAAASANAALLRSNADFAAVVVSDSGDHDSTPVADYHRWLVGLKSPNQVFFTGFVALNQGATVSNCYYDDPIDLTKTARIRDLSALTGTPAQEICSDGAVAGRVVAEQLTARRRQFPLSVKPDTSAGVPSVQVAVNGQDVPAASSNGATNWRYEAETQRVVFEPSAAPAWGSTVQITYSRACR